MASEPVFTITYWGITGTLSVPLKPAEVTDKLNRAVHHLLEHGHLANLKPGPDSLAAVRRLVEGELPFHLRSTYGGNTTCVEVQTTDTLIILDCGSGFRELGIALERRWNDPAYRGDRTQALAMGADAFAPDPEALLLHLADVFGADGGT